MEIIKFNLDFWRHSLREFSSFPFYKCKNFDEILLLVEQSLKNIKVSSWLDKLLHREDGWHYQFFQRHHNSKWYRQFRYITDILIDMVIKNDIGLRGGISPVLEDSAINYGNNFTQPPQLPIGVNCVDVTQAGLSQIDSLIQLKKNSNDYIIPYETELFNTNIDSDVRCRANELAINIISNLKLSNENFKCAIFAVDFFVRKNKDILPIEWHFPGRGLGAHFLPFLCNDHTGQFSKILDDCSFSINSFFNTKILLSSSPLPFTSFHAMDDILIKCLNKESVDARVLNIELDVQDNVNFFYDRSFPESLSKPNCLIVNEAIVDNDLDYIQDKFGGWVMVKSQLNAPWWSKHRFRPKVCMVKGDLKSIVNSSLKEGNPLIIQELVCDSLDNKGRFGEMRQYYFLVK